MPTPGVVQQFRGDSTRLAATRDKDNDHATVLRPEPVAVDPVYLTVFIDGLAIDHQGIVWVCRLSGDSLGWIDPKTGQTGEVATGSGSRPRRIATAPDGSLWVAYYDNGRLAAEAHLLYEETPDSVQRRARQTELRRLSPQPVPEQKGRPTKRDQRQLNRVREGQGPSRYPKETYGVPVEEIAK